MPWVTTKHDFTQVLIYLMVFGKSQLQRRVVTPLDLSQYHGVWRFKKLPFGLLGSPCTFSLVLSKALHGINWKFAMTYVDDILVFSSNFEQHLRHLDIVFERLRSAKLRIKPSKCSFAADKVKYLGHVITKTGVTVEEGKVTAVRDFPTPTDEQQIRSFLGLCSYYRRFVKNFAHISAPLSALLKKDSDFIWTEQCNTAFESLKNHLTNTLVLAFPVMSRPFKLTTDASGYPIGYVKMMRMVLSIQLRMVVAHYINMRKSGPSVKENALLSLKALECTIRI